MKLSKPTLLSESNKEIPADGCGVCLGCGCELGFFIKLSKTGRERKLFYFSDREHPKLKRKRERCVDCFEAEFGRLPKAPNTPQDDFVWMLGAPKEEVQALKNQKAITKSKLITIYGEEEGLKRWDAYRGKQAYTSSSDYFLEEKGMTEGEVAEFHRKRACTLENLVQRHGEEEGKKRWDSYLERQRHTCSREYFIDQYGEEGLEKFENFERSKRHTVKGKMEHFGVSFLEASTIISRYWRRKGLNKKVSFSAQRFFDGVLDRFYSDTKGVYTDLLTHEFGVPTPDGEHYFFYDFVDTQRKLCIEFHGDDWHGNPSKYSGDQYLHLRSSTVRDVWEYDSSRVRLMEGLGFKVLVIWESDHKNEPEKAFKKLEEFFDGNC